MNLPGNGIRLRFDGQSQRLRLIEVLDFSKNKLTLADANKKDDLAKIPGGGGATALNYKHLYTLLGATHDGEYTVPASKENTGYGLYILSYPGIAFSFPVLDSTYNSKQHLDHVALLSSSATLPAASMAVFYGRSWPEVRSTLFTNELPDPKTLFAGARQKDTYADDIGLIKILGAGRLELQRPWAQSPFLLKLGRTTPQDLVAELGPPDAIYHKHDQRMMIHKRAGSGARERPNLHDDGMDTDQSSTHTVTDASGSDEDNGSDHTRSIPGECFYNYFHHGFDIMISTPTAPSDAPPSSTGNQQSKPSAITPAVPLVATKIILHSNVPGSYSFNRHRRSRWEISYLSSASANSETPFSTLKPLLHTAWSSIYSSPEEARRCETGMVVNRSWGDSPGSSVELLGSWEDGIGDGKGRDGGRDAGGGGGLGNTTLFGWPGLVFEVLKGGWVAGVTVF